MHWHPKVGKAVKQGLRELYRTLDPVALLAEMRDAQTELGTGADRRGTNTGAANVHVASLAPDAAKFAKGLGKTVEVGEPRATHRRIKRPYKTRVRMPSMLDPQVADIERWLVVEPQLTAIAILDRLGKRAPTEFGPPQHSIVQRLLKTLRTKAAHQLIASKVTIVLAVEPAIVPAGTIAGSTSVQTTPPW